MNEEKEWNPILWLFEKNKRISRANLVKHDPEREKWVEKALEARYIETVSTDEWGDPQYMITLLGVEARNKKDKRRE